MDTDKRKGKGKSKDKEKGRGKGKDKDKPDAEYRKVLKLKECDPAFNLKGALIGEHGKNVQHIQDQSQSKPWFKGEVADGMYLEISSGSSDSLEKAVQMAKDLIKTVYRQYEDWQAERPEGVHGPKNSSGGKGKGKSKKKDHDDEPPA